MDKGTVELSMETLVIILSVIIVAALIIFFVISWATSPELRSSNTCDFICSLKESITSTIFFWSKPFIPKIDACGC